jgi:hypothetical protein
MGGPTYPDVPTPTTEQQDEIIDDVNEANDTTSWVQADAANLLSQTAANPNITVGQLALLKALMLLVLEEGG